jgi:phage shock protein A
MAGVLERIRTILAANVNNMLDKAEDPEAMLEEYLRRAEAERGELREEMVDARAALLVLQRQRKASEEQAHRWGARAEEAVRHGDDGLARTGLRRQRNFEAATEQWGEQIAAQERTVSSLESAARSLSERIADAQIRLSSIISRHRAALATTRVEKALQSVGEAGGAMRDFGRIEEKVDREAAKAEVLAEMSAESVEARFRALESSEDEAEIDARLAEMKARLGA